MILSIQFIFCTQLPNFLHSLHIILILYHITPTYKLNIMSDQAKKQQDSQTKLGIIVEKYKHRFQNTIVDFKKFIETRVVFDEVQKEKLYNFIQDRFDESFDEDELQNLLHIVSAHQAGQSIESMTKKDLGKFYKIKFISKKGQDPQIVKKEQIAENTIQKQRGAKQKEQLELKRKQKQEMRKKREEEERMARIKNEEKIMKASQPGKYEQVVQISDDEAEEPKQKYFSTIRTNEHLNTIMEESEFGTKTSEQIFMPQERDFDQEMQDSDRNQSERLQAEKFIDEPVRWPTEKIQTGKKTEKMVYQVVSDPNQKRYEEQSRGYGFERGNKSQENKNQHEIAEDLTMDEEVVSITRYEKTGQDFMNPIIKFQINFKNQFTTWRRYSEIERLMGYLRKKYEGVVLPQMPPKQGLKGGLTYLWGIDETFLFDRREKLNTMLNRLMNKNQINKDEKLIRFLTDENYEIPAENTDDYWQAINGWKDFVLNYNQLKDYGVAYYKFVSQYKNKPLTTELAREYEQLEEDIKIIRAADEHRRKINANFDSRRQIMYSFKVAVRQPCKTELDKILEKASIQCKQIAIQYANYVQLKLNESWLLELKKQKQSQEGNKSMAKIQSDLEQTTKRIKKIETNFSVSIKDYKKKLALILESLGKNMIQWRKKIHP